MNLQKAREAYEHDPQYHNLVELLIQQIETLNMAPSEIREAGVFACILLAERRVYPDVTSSEEYKRRVLGEFTSVGAVCEKCHIAIGPGSKLCKQCRKEAEDL